MSPTIDCFDGMLVGRIIDTYSNAELANTILKNAIATLKLNEKPVVHSDRECHYRQSKLIQIMEEASLMQFT